MTFSLPDQFVELPPGPVDDLALKETIEAIQRNLTALTQQIGGLDAAGGVLRLVGDGGRKIAFGTTGAIFVSGSITNTINVSHGLGVAPVWVGVVPWAEDSGFWLPIYGSGGWTSTIFQLFANDVRGFGHGPGNLSGTRWMAVG